MSEFQYYFAQREALETIIYLYEVVRVKDKFDLMRYDSSGDVSAGLFDESWRRFVVKLATGRVKQGDDRLSNSWMNSKEWINEAFSKVTDGLKF